MSRNPTVLTLPMPLSSLLPTLPRTHPLILARIFETALREVLVDQSIRGQRFMKSCFLYCLSLACTRHDTRILAKIHAKMHFSVRYNVYTCIHTTHTPQKHMDHICMRTTRQTTDKNLSIFIQYSSDCPLHMYAHDKAKPQV